MSDDISAPMTAVAVVSLLRRYDEPVWWECSDDSYTCKHWSAYAEQVIRVSNAQAVVAALEQTLARSDGCEGGQVASALADAKAEAARLQEETKAARLCKTKSMTASRCSCKKDADNDCVTCGERVWWSERQAEHNCAEGWKS